MVTTTSSRNRESFESAGTRAESITDGAKAAISSDSPPRFATTISLATVTLAEAGVGSVPPPAWAGDWDPWAVTLLHLREVPVGRVMYAAFGKRAIDFCGALLLLVLASPVLFVAMLWIAVDTPGNPIFRQQRIGLGGTPFTLIKLRTMHASDSGKLIWTRDEVGRVRHKQRDDPRVTRAGKWLRRASIDELPQLINVILGDMSLVGPRPELVQIVGQYEAWQHQRHLVRPGMTGWWQVSGRGDLPMHESTELDLHYVRELTFGMDVQIGLKTVGVVAKGRGAY